MSGGLVGVIVTLEPELVAAEARRIAGCRSGPDPLPGLAGGSLVGRTTVVMEKRVAKATLFSFPQCPEISHYSN